MSSAVYLRLNPEAPMGSVSPGQTVLVKSSGSHNKQKERKIRKELVGGHDIAGGWVCARVNRKHFTPL